MQRYNLDDFTGQRGQLDERNLDKYVLPVVLRYLDDQGYKNVADKLEQLYLNDNVYAPRYMDIVFVSSVAHH